jgi:hypothetical protein
MPLLPDWNCRRRCLVLLAGIAVATVVVALIRWQVRVDDRVHPIQAASPPFRLPESGEDWDFVGTFRLQDDRGRVTDVRLYVEDSDSVASNQALREGWGEMTYPNHLQLHAFYRRGDEEWFHKPLSRGARAHFVRVREPSRSEVVLEFRTAYVFNIRLTDDPQKDIAAAMADKRQNRSFIKRLVLVDGIPAIK